MFGGPWWQDVVWWIAWLATMTLVMGWLAKSRLRPVTCTEDGFLLRYSRSYLGVGLVCTFLFLGSAVFSLYAPDAVRDTQVRELLATTAGGSPPSPWV